MSKQIKADAALILVTMIWGASFPLMKNVLDEIPQYPYLALRFIVATLVLGILFRKKFALLNRKYIINGGIIGLMLFGGMALQMAGLHYTTASKSAFITGFNVIFVPIVSAILLKKKPGASSIIGVVLACTGMFFLNGGMQGGLNLGDVLTLLCAFCFTFQIIFIDKFTEGQDAALLSVLQIGFAAVMYVIIWSAMGFTPVAITPSAATTIGITGILGTAVAFATQTMVQKFTSPTHTALIFTAEPVFGAAFASIIPNSSGKTEIITLTTLVGCIFILAAMIISEVHVDFRKLFGKRASDMEECGEVK